MRHVKNKWMIQMVKDFLCRESKNKFNLQDTGNNVDKYINQSVTQYLIVYRVEDTADKNTSKSNDSVTTEIDELSMN